MQCQSQAHRKLFVHKIAKGQLAAVLQRVVLQGCAQDSAPHMRALQHHQLLLLSIQLRAAHTGLQSSILPSCYCKPTHGNILGTDIPEQTSGKQAEHSRCMLAFAVHANPGCCTDPGSEELPELNPAAARAVMTGGPYAPKPAWRQCHLYASADRLVLSFTSINTCSRGVVFVCSLTPVGDPTTPDMLLSVTSSQRPPEQCRMQPPAWNCYWMSIADPKQTILSLDQVDLPEVAV